MTESGQSGAPQPERNRSKGVIFVALGLMLFVVTLILNVIGLGVVRKYREQYD